jgi:nucleoside triphosphate diphosphatase
MTDPENPYTDEIAPYLDPQRVEPYTLDDLIRIMAVLRTPGIGCPWDIEQTFRSIAPYTIEEAYEVADAIERGDTDDLRDELGDLLLQVVYHARIAEEQGSFAFAEVADTVCRKMVRRHPYVFGDPVTRVETRANRKGLWDRIKAEEKAAKRNGAAPETPESLLDGVPANLPALARAVKLQATAARIGFDWPSVAPVLAKLKEEIAELEEAIADGHQSGGLSSATTDNGRQHSGGLPSATTDSARQRSGGLPSAIADITARQKQAVAEEFGDMLFVLANLARHLAIDPDAALRAANAKFNRRFRHVETRLRQDGRPPEQVTLDEMDAWWDEAKAAEKKAAGEPGADAPQTPDKG